MANEKIIRNYTEGNLPVQILSFSVPFMISNLLQVLYSIVDMVVVGNVLGSAGLSAIATASQVVSFMTMMCVGFSTGGQVYISQLIGAGKRKDLNRAIGTLFTIIFIIGALMTAIGLIFSRNIVSLLQTPEESFEMSASYLLICSAGMLFTYGYNIVSSVLRGMGNSKQPCMFIIIAAVINLVLDIIFVMRLNMGVKGAAYATIIGQAVSFIWSLFYLVRNKKSFGFDFKPKSFIPERFAFKRLVSLGVPFALRSASVNISMMFVTSLVNNIGVDASAVFGVGLKVDDIARKISLSMNYSTSTFVGQNFAAQNFGRIRKSVYWSWIYSFIIYLVFSIIYVFNIEGMFRLFTSDPGVIELAPVFVHAIIWSFPAMILMRGTNGFIQGIGNSTLCLIFAIADGFILRIGLSYLLGVTLDFGLFGLFLGYGLATYGTSLPGVIYFLSGVWKKRKLKI